MLTNAQLIAFVGTKKPEEARRFYSEALGLTLVADEQFAIVFDANGTMLRVSKVPSFEPLPFTVLGWEVSDIHRDISILTGQGVVFEQFDMLDHDDLGITTFPDGTQVAWFRDPDGNILSLTQSYSGKNRE